MVRLPRRGILPLPRQVGMIDIVLDAHPDEESPIILIGELSEPSGQQWGAVLSPRRETTLLRLENVPRMSLSARERRTRTPFRLGMQVSAACQWSGPFTAKPWVPGTGGLLPAHA